MRQTKSRKLIARKRVRGLIIFLIVILSFVLVYDVYNLIRGWL